MHSWICFQAGISVKWLVLGSIHTDELGHERWWSQFTSMMAFQRVLAESVDPCWRMLSYFPCFLDCWIAVFLDGFGPKAKWPWAHRVLPAALWCCPPASHLPPALTCRAQGCQLIHTGQLPLPPSLPSRELSSGRQGRTSQTHWL